MFVRSTSLIIPTKNRYHHLKKFFNNIKKYTDKFDEIIIVDSSEEIEFGKIKKKFSKSKKIRVLKSKPSISIQRNLGIKNYNKKNKFIMFCDDDILFKKNALKNMDKFILKNPSSIGYGFNLIGKKNNTYVEKLKKSILFKELGIYHFKSGVVCSNGWHTKTVNVKKDLYVQWLSTQACIYKSKVFRKNVLFDTSLGRYSYLDDLFISFRLNKSGKLKVSYNSEYYHPNNIERNNFYFGIQEVKNRYKFVKKNKLSIDKFYFTVFIKILHTLFLILIFRLNKIPKFFGNIFGVILCLSSIKKK